jgi:hypothetical protein
LECDQKKETKIEDDTDCIINVDETPCYLENPSKETVDIKEKKIEILTYGKAKCRFTAVLAISASGKKLPSLIICKGQVGKRKEIHLKALDYIKYKNIYVKCQEKSWCIRIFLNFGLIRYFYITKILSLRKNVINVY